MLKDSWEDLKRGLGRLAQELLADLTQSLQALASIHERRPLQPPPVPDSLASFESGWQQLQREHLDDPHQALLKSALLSKSVSACQRYFQSLDDLARRCPRELQLSGQELCAVVAGDAGRRPLRLRFSRRTGLFHVRAALVREVRRLIPPFQKLASHYLGHLTEGSQSLAQGWRQLSGQWCWHLLDARQPLPVPGPLWNRQQAQQSLQSLERHCAGMASAWAQALLASYPGGSAQVAALDEAPLLNGEEWAKSLNATQSLWAVELSLAQAMRSNVQVLQELNQNLEDEVAALAGELKQVREWVEDFDPDHAQPAQEAQVRPAIHRLKSFRERLKTSLGRPAKGSEPAALAGGLLETVAEAEEGQLQAFLSTVESDHRRLLQALEQAREAMSHVQQGSDPDQAEILAQTTQNVRALLEHWSDYDPEWRRQISLSAPRFCASFFVEAQNRCESQPSRRIRYAVQRFSWNAREQSHDLRKMLLPVSRRLYDRSARLANHFLSSIGWSASPILASNSILRRPVLSEDLSVGGPEANVPAIYRRLFSVDPVADPTFLVGREQELAAFEEAYRWWTDNRPVSVLITGHRGSGKTSLLNCAVRNFPNDIELVRGDFCQRVASPEELERHLSRLLGLAEGACLQEALDQSRRIIVLEEVERTFLRKIGGYEAARHLLRLIARSNRTTLWVLGMNRVGFDLLHAALSFGASFSHRIDTAAVRPAMLQQAVLSRHNLSGLRLHLPKPEKVHWWRPSPDPETEYFKAFAARTDGIFRTAFELWQAHVDKVQAGVLFMAPMAQLKLLHVVEDLDLFDLFTLVAIIQHGSLTAEEGAQVFSVPVEVCQAQLDELVSRELIGPDPTYPGLRVRPETAPLVRAVLYKKNLI